MARLTFLGAARTVTGSQYVVEADRARLDEAALALADRIAREREFETHVPVPDENVDLACRGPESAV